MDETNKQAILAALVISLVVTAIGLYFYFSDPDNKSARPVAVVEESDTEKSSEEESEGDTVTAVSEEYEETDEDTDEETVSTALDNGWMNYTSSQGISFDYPKEALGTDCSGKKDVMVSIKTFEDKENGYIYLTADCADKLDTLRTKTIQASKAENGYKQEKIANAWGIAVTTVKSEGELNAFVRQHYGTGGCEAGERELTEKQNGVYIVTIKGKDWSSPGDRITTSQTCKVDYAYKILYAPEKGKAVSIVLGQGCTFSQGETQGDCYADEDKIIESITFD